MASMSFRASSRVAPKTELSSGECRTWLSRHHEGRIDYRTGRGARSLVVRYAVQADAVLVRVPTYNDLLQYAPGESVTLEVEERCAPDTFETVTVTGMASLLDTRVGALAEDWPKDLPTDVIRVPIQRIDGFVEAS